MKYTIIHYKPVGFRAGQYVAAMKRVKTKDLRKYIEKHDLDPVFVFEGWPQLEAKQSGADGRTG